MKCVEPLWTWVRDDRSKAGPCDKRLEIFRSFGSNKTDSKTKALVKECYRLVVQTLLAYAQGTPPKKSEKKTKSFPVRATHTTTPPFFI